ncbi:hypothetical protein GCM10010232_03820 [Streptomyces amakusaensis]
MRLGKTPVSPWVCPRVRPGAPGTKGMRNDPWACFLRTGRRKPVGPPAAHGSGDCIGVRQKTCHCTECDSRPLARSHLTHPKRNHFRITSFRRVLHTLEAPPGGLNRIK